MAETIFEKTCRTCNSETNDLVNIFKTSIIFDDEPSSMLIYTALNKLSFMEKVIKEGDDLPEKICNTCIDRLRTSYTFKKLICESQSEFEVALKYEKRRRGNKNMKITKATEQPEPEKILQYNYDIKFVDDSTFYLNSDEENIEIIDMEESDVEEEQKVEKVVVRKKEDKKKGKKKDTAIKVKHIEESSKLCVVCKRTYRSLEALRFHQTAMHRGISILHD